jgi:Domain of unknown function (DUF4588)
MRTLKGSLPSASSSRPQASQPPEPLLQSFKQAALAVTTLYKTAASDHAKAYEEGYQDALEGLVGFLDKNNFGLQDGEGWGVRKWAMERYHGLGRQSQSSGDSDEERDEDKRDEHKRARSSSPILEAKLTPENSIPQISLSMPQPIPRSESAPPVPAPLQDTARKTTINSTVPTSDFTFRPMHEAPSVVEMDIEQPDVTSLSGAPTGLPTVQVSLIQRPQKPQSNHPHNTRSYSRQASSISNLGAGAGTKRRQPFGDFFDISGTPGRDGHNNNKRGRY